MGIEVAAMHRFYPDRDYVRSALYALAAGISLSNAPASARADGETLWDALAYVPSGVIGAPVLPPPDTPARRTLGPVPGFSLQAPSGFGQSPSSVYPRLRPRSSGMLGSVGDWFQHLKRMTGTRIEVEGNQNLSFRAESISGNTDSYRNATYFGRGNNGVFYRSDLTIDATLFRYFHYRTQINNDLYINPNDPNLNRVKIDYRDKRTRFEWGDIQAGFQGNTLIDFNRFMNGFKLENQWAKNFRTQFLYSRTRAETRTITIPGNGSSGPYYVFAGLIVDGTAQVRINDRLLTMGQDYTLSPLDGRLEFKNRVILPTDTIAISFETIGFNQQRGNIYGGRIEYDPAPAFKLGFTNVMQQAQGTTGPQQVTQQFFGFETPGAAYTLNAPVDVSKPMTLTINGRPMQRGVDFIVEANLTNQIRILPPVPRTQQILFTYTPLNLNPVPGNRSVMGMDATLTLGKLGRFTAETAFSGLSVSGNNIGGNAMQLRAELQPLRGLRANLTYRDVSPTFSSIQTPGFNRNEKSADVTLDYTPWQNVRFSVNAQRALRPSYLGGFGVNQFTISQAGNDVYDQYGASANYSFDKGKGNVNFSRNSLSTRFAQGGRSTNLSDTLSLNYSPRNQLSFDLSFSRNNSDTNTIFGGTGQTTAFVSNASTFSQSFRINWTPSERLALRAGLSNNNITNLATNSESRSTAQNAEVGLRYTAGQSFAFNYSLGLSDTGNLSNLLNDGTGNNNNGTGGNNANNNNGNNNNVIGTPTRAVLNALRTRQVTAGGAGSQNTFNGNLGSFFGGGANAGLGGFGSYSGFYGNDLNTGYGASGFGGRNVNHRVGIEFAPRKTNLNFNINYDLNSSIGDYQFNSDRNNLSFTASWRPSQTMNFDLNYMTSRIAFAGGQGGSTANTLGLTFSGNPFGGKLNLMLNWMMMRNAGSLSFGLTGGNNAAPVDTSQTMNAFSARLEYPIGGGRTLFASMNHNDVAGYLGSANTEMRIGFGIPIYRLQSQDIMLQLGWQIFSLNNKDPQQAQFNYRVSTLAAEIGFNFRTR